MWERRSWRGTASRARPTRASPLQRRRMRPDPAHFVCAALRKAGWGDCAQVLGSRMKEAYVSPAVPYDPGEHADPVHTAAPAESQSTDRIEALLSLLFE
jgi:hypothetical protein